MRNILYWTCCRIMKFKGNTWCSMNQLSSRWESPLLRDTITVTSINIYIGIIIWIVWITFHMQTISMTINWNISLVLTFSCVLIINLYSNDRYANLALTKTIRLLLSFLKYLETLSIVYKFVCLRCEITFSGRFWICQTTRKSSIFETCDLWSTNKGSVMYIQTRRITIHF